jgi:hypothetical protein
MTSSDFILFKGVSSSSFLTRLMVGSLGFGGDPLDFLGLGGPFSPKISDGSWELYH